MTNGLSLPVELDAVFHEFRTCELTTLGKNCDPVTWPTEPFYQPEKKRFLITTSIGLAQKAFNIRRNPRVSLLFSNATGSGLVDPPAVLVQGDAIVSDEIQTSFTGELAEFGKMAHSRMPSEEMFSSNLVTRYLFDWFYMRLVICTIPRLILWWDHADFNLKPHKLEVNHVG